MHIENIEELGMKPEDYAKIQNQVDALYMGQRFPLAVIVGSLSAILSGILWALISAATGYQIGFMAIGVGFIVGQSIRFSGKGITKKFGFLGATLSILACIFGNVLTVILQAGRELGISFFDIFPRINFSEIPFVMMETFHIYDLLFYGIAIYEGYRFSFMSVNEFKMLEDYNEKQSIDSKNL